MMNNVVKRMLALFDAVFLTPNDINTCRKSLQSLLHLHFSTDTMTTYRVDLYEGLWVIGVCFDG